MYKSIRQRSWLVLFDKLRTKEKSSAVYKKKKNDEWIFCFSSSQLKLFHPRWQCYTTVPLEKKVMYQHLSKRHFIRFHRPPKCKKTACCPLGFFDEFSLVLFLWEPFSSFHTSISHVFSSRGGCATLRGDHCLFRLCSVLSLLPL